ncbi:phytanoyl-CoA dioxygenase family protein [Solimonas terrae]|uniref:Phytanoyl-CoA dioxygenase family protein n=1 Tax=Solimonas terrae TaxID=1396819 RepID=A0A6M2BTP1_9GAMM|nr:phytanoyl-CoA dioxygenase family protein [Solimonas terrae]NGY05483.1 phytanoyl-CoA dioxygenase family protein [Solimonas terrae]
MVDNAPAFDVEKHLQNLQRDGYSIIDDFLTASDLREVREGLAPHLDRHSGRNNFEGHKTERVYTLVARGAIFERITEDPRVLALLDRLLQPGYLLTASQAIRIHPGETPQPIHYDDQFYRIPRPRPAISVSTIVAVDPFTADNGGTDMLPGSHLWSDAQIAGIYDGHDADAPARDDLQAQLRATRMPAGACVVFLGTLLHRGGANRSDAPRLAFSNQYCEPWARTQENYFLGVPASLARDMSPRLQQLLGYDIWAPFMGHVSASHPAKALREDWVAPVMNRSHSR